MKLRITKVQTPYPPDVRARHRAHTATLRLAKAADARRSGPLAVIGGGPSISNHVPALRAWSGAVWAINGAMQWCRANGIAASYVTFDPERSDLEAIRSGEECILADHLSPVAFDLLHAKVAHVLTCTTYDDVLVHGTTATGTAHLAILMGHWPVTFFGCESSYGDTMHAYQSTLEGAPLPIPEHLMRVVCNGAAYLTKPELLVQAEYLSAVIRALPDVYAERSGGLLAAMVRDPDYDLVAATQALHDIVEFEETAA